MLIAAAVSVSLMTACGKAEEAEGFVPRLDTQAEITIDIAGFFGNYEALDAVTNSFNKIYPNVSFGYEQVGAEHLNEFMQNNPYVDIFMTNDDNIRSSAQPERYVSEFCVGPCR